MLLRVVAVLACAAYAAAVHCVKCVGMIEDYHLNPYSVCHRELEGSHEMLTQCDYAQPRSLAGYICNYNDMGESTGGWALCPERVEIGNVYNGCPQCNS